MHPLPHHQPAANGTAGAEPWTRDQLAADALFSRDGRGQLAPPPHGWRATFGREFAPCQPFHRPRWRQLLELLGPSLRYLFRFYLRKRFVEKRRPFIDGLVHVPYAPIYGVPLGGIGCGSIGRGFRGEFCRFQLVPGLYEYAVVEADCFIVTLRRRGATVLQRALTFRHFRRPALSGWACGLPEDSCAYHGLYPCAWTVYDLPYRGVRLLCRQTSPVVPHDYTDSCLPVAMFEWRVENTNEAEDLEVSLTFCFKNGDGTAADAAGGVTVEPFSTLDEQQRVVGSMIHQNVGDMPCTYGIGAVAGDNATVTLWPRFDPAVDPTSANRLWASLIGRGRLLSWPEVAEAEAEAAANQKTPPTRPGEEAATAVCVTCRVAAGGVADSVKFCLAWHMPDVRFRSGEQRYTRRHARWFGGSQSEATVALIGHAFKRLPDWLAGIDQWHAGVLDDASLPAWFKSALFNESYYLSDSGSVWLDGGAVNDFHGGGGGRWRCPIKAEMGLFAYLEGHEYRMFSTYDVHTYASWAFLENFPKLQVAMQYDFAKSAVDDDPTKVYWVVTNSHSGRNRRMALPHDLGDPEDEPFVRVNSYIMMCSDEWRDLNPKFVLCVYRDWKLLPWHNADYLADMMPAVEGLMRRCLQWDTDGDGLVENTGYADQTYDAWPMTGVSAYCAGLWLAALHATAEMSTAVGRADTAAEWRQRLAQARASYLAKLWTGEQFRFDTGGRFADTVMSDQLFGYWMLRASSVGVEDDSWAGLLPSEAVRVTMATVYRCNCLAQGGGGRMGLFNGGLLGGRGSDVRSIQAEESWIGVSYGVAALMLAEGLTAEGWACAQGTYRTVWDDFGLAYQTPEAIFEDRRFRSLGYMRPLCVWALLRAHRLAAAATATDGQT